MWDAVESALTAAVTDPLRIESKSGLLDRLRWCFCLATES